MKINKRAMWSPLANIGLGAAIGYLTGGATDSVIGWTTGRDNTTEEAKKARRRQKLIGALIGTIPGLLQALAQKRITYLPEGYSLGDDLPKDKSIFRYTPDELYQASDNARFNIDNAAREDSYGVVKTAFFGDPIARPVEGMAQHDLLNRYINTDQFGNMIWRDPNTRFTTALDVTKTLDRTSNRVGSNFVTPGQVATTLVNAGIGSLTGRVIGGTLGALAGLSPQTQNTIQNIGMWGGLMNGIGNQLR